MRNYFRTILVLLTISLPVTAWGRSEHHQYRQTAQARLRLQRELERIEKLRRGQRYPHFQLDVF